MDIFVIIIIAVGFIALLAVVLSQFRSLQNFQKQRHELQSSSMEQLEKRLDQISQQNSQSERAVFQSLQQQFGQSSQIIKDVTEKLTRLDETNRQVMGFSDQLQQLQDILKNPKQRGVLGEYFLETVLKNVLPPKSFQLQYAFKNGEAVDAVIFVGDKIIPIDSKFSLENYNRVASERDPLERERLEKVFKQDLKNRIDETSKYIRPEEGTMDFAFMFIPAEAIYYDLLVNQIGVVKMNTRDLIEYAFNEKHVMIVSPTSFLAYLQTVLQGMRALQFEESAKEIRQRVEQLGRHLMSYENFLTKLGQHLGTTVNTYNAAAKEFKKVDKDLYRITEKKGSFEVAALDRPQTSNDTDEE